VNRYSPVCVQSVVHRKRATLNHVAFNPVNPVLVVGDSRGAVHSLKLSPNLRRVTKDAKKAMMNNDLDLVRTLEVRSSLLRRISYRKRRVQKPNSWMYSFIYFCGHNLKSFKT
jgi:dynein intermediate chain 1